MKKNVSLSFGTVWIEIPVNNALHQVLMSLSFGTVWIEIHYHLGGKWNVSVTVLRDGVD